MVASTGAPPAVELAGFWVRTAAYLVDAFLLSFVGGAFPYLVIVTSNSGPNGQPTNAIGPSLLVSFIYFVFFWSHLGGSHTLGMRLFRLKVLGEDGGQLGIGQAIVRWVGLWVSFAFCFIGVLWVAGDGRKQGWHDKLAHTYVVYA